MTNTSVPGDTAVQAVNYIICRNATHYSNGTRMASAKDKDTEFGAVLYIIVVLTFYSLGIVVMIVKYLKTEKKEMEEEMVLDSFFKGIPDKRIQNEKEVVNRVAIQAFHTMTASRGSAGQNIGDNPGIGQSRGNKSNSQQTSLLTPGCNPTVNQHQRNLSLSHYRRGRYSIQPMYIDTINQRNDDDNSDKDDDNAKNMNPELLMEAGLGEPDYHGAFGGDGYSCVEISDELNDKEVSDILESEPDLFPTTTPGKTADKKVSKKNKCVLFSDEVDSVPSHRGELRNRKDQSGECVVKKGSTNNAPSPGVHTDVGCVHEVPEIKFTRHGSENGEIGSNKDIPRLDHVTKKTHITADSPEQDGDAQTENDLAESYPKSILPPKKRKNVGLGFVSSQRKPSDQRSVEDSPDLGHSWNSMRMSSLEKGTGDGSSYDSSSSLLTRIHLAETLTPPMKVKTSQGGESKVNTLHHAAVHFPRKSDFSGERDSQGEARRNESGGSPSTTKTQRTKSDERQKLTAVNVPMQPSYDSTSSSTTGLTTRVNVLSGRDQGKKTCLVTDL